MPGLEEKLSGRSAATSQALSRPQRIEFRDAALKHARTLETATRVIRPTGKQPPRALLRRLVFILHTTDTVTGYIAPTCLRI